ncbi:MAG: TolC family protein [Elusimicrobia bacterium]|nr:TolC family protein [Elusimicrobiota bacterium]
MSTLFAAAAAILLAGPVFAQEAAPSAKRYALAELVSLALKSTPLLTAQDARVEENSLSAAQARVWEGPSAGILLGRKSEPAGSGPAYELSASVPLPLTGEPGLRGRLLDLETESSRVKRAASEVLVTAAVAQGAFEYASGRRKAAFAESRRKRFELIQSYLSGRVFPTPQRKAESRIVQHRLNNLAADAIQSEAGAKASLEKLRTYAPLAPGETPDVEVPWLSGARRLDGKEWLDKALADNPELRVQRLSVRGAGLDRALASREGLPDASLVASYERAKAAETEKTYGVGLSFAFPSWNANRSGIRSAEKKKLAEERLLGFAERKLQADMLHALVEYEAARQVVLKYTPETLTDLEAQLRAADEGFSKGQVDLLTLLELDGSAAETFGRALDAQTDLAAKAAELFVLTADRDALTKLASF